MVVCDVSEVTVEATLVAGVVSVDEVVIELDKVPVLVDLVIVSLDKVVTELGKVVVSVSPVRTVLAGVVCVNLSCSSTVLNVVPRSSTEAVVDIGISVVALEVCAVLTVVLCAIVSSEIDVLASVVGCSEVTTLVVSGTEVVSFVSSSGMDRSNP